MSQAEKNNIPEKTEQVTLSTEKATEPKMNEMKIATDFGKLSLMKIRTKKGKFKREKELSELEEKVKKIKGLKAKKTQTIWHKGVIITIVKGYPVPKEFTNLFSKEQLGNHFE
jgi:hypothetical protein